MRIENFSIKNKAEAEDEEDDDIGNGGGENELSLDEMERKFQIENIAKNNDDSEYRPELDNTPRLKEKVIEEPVLLSQR